MVSTALSSLRSRLDAARVGYREQVLGSSLTTYAIGGPIALVIEPRNRDEVVTALQHCAEHSVCPRVLGNGSNLLISSNGLQQVVIRLRDKELTTEGSSTIVSGGYPLMSLSRLMCERGLSGLEFAGGIPGSFGGACFMNAGAHGGEMSERLRWIEVATCAGLTRISSHELPWRYRHSGLHERFGAEPFVVVSGALELVPGDPTTALQRRAQCLEERKARQPLQAASAGSVFRNPVASPSISHAESAGALIERCGLKGIRVGGAQVSDLHANWIINPQRMATSLDVRTLIERCRSAVRDQFGVELREEVVYWE